MNDTGRTVVGALRAILSSPSFNSGKVPFRQDSGTTPAARISAIPASDPCNTTNQNETHRVLSLCTRCAYCVLFDILFNKMAVCTVLLPLRALETDVVQRTALDSPAPGPCHLLCREDDSDGILAVSPYLPPTFESCSWSAFESCATCACFTSPFALTVFFLPAPGYN